MTMGILSLLSVCLFIAVATCRVIDKMDIATESEEEPYVSTGRCGNGLVYYKRHCYLFSEDKLTWFEAMSVCAQVVVSRNGRAGWLSHISNEAEQNFLKNEVRRSNRDYYWVGGTDIMLHKHYVWYRWRNFGHQDTKYWGQGEPNNAGNAEHCTEFTSDGKLNDNNCEQKHYFICERRL